MHKCLFTMILFIIPILPLHSQEIPANANSNIQQVLSGVKPVFIENRGQWSDEVRFVAMMGGMNVWITNDGITYDFYQLSGGRNNDDSDFMKSNQEPIIRKGHVVKMSFDNFDNKSEPIANKNVRGLSKTGGSFNYLKGSRQNWVPDVPLFEEVMMEEVCKGISARLYYDNGSFRYDLIAKPGADLNNLNISFAGTGGVNVTRNGDLTIQTSLGPVTQGELFAYQVVNGSKKQVKCNFSTNAAGEVTFDVGDYNPDKELIIDPLVYSTFIGGSANDTAYDIETDDSGNAYITGKTTDAATNFPTTSGAYSETHNGGNDVFVTKLSADGSSLIYSTFIGGDLIDVGYCIAINEAGNAFVTGKTNDAATDYPTTAGAYDETHNGGNDVFVTKLSADGSSLVYSTLIGGSDSDEGFGIDIDVNGNAYISGSTIDAATDYPTTAGAYDQTHNGSFDVFVTKLSSDGSSLTYSTFIGSDGTEGFWSKIAVDGSDNAYVSGATTYLSNSYPTTAGAYDETYNGNTDAFVTKLSTDGSSLVYSTFVGGSGEEGCKDIAINSAGNAFIIGTTPTSAGDFPTTAGAYSQSFNGGQEIYVTKLSADGSSLVFSTLIGGSDNEYGWAIDVNSEDMAYFTGGTYGNNYPTTVTAYDNSFNGERDLVVSVLTADGSALHYSTLIGSSETAYSYGIDVRANRAYICGYALSAASQFPTTAGAYDESHNGLRDAIVFNLSIPTSIPTLPEWAAIIFGIMMLTFGSIWIFRRFA